MADAYYGACRNLFCVAILEAAVERASEEALALRGCRHLGRGANRGVDLSRREYGNGTFRLTLPMASLPEQERYRRLPGRSRRLFTLADAQRQRLWLGREHILNLRIAWATESHRRFQLRDIQAITVTGTERGRNLNYVLGIVTAILGGTAAYLLVAFPGSTGAGTLSVMSGLAAAFCAVYFLVNVALGKTCVCRLYTAVQTEELKSLGRIRSARRFLDIVTPLIEAAQGPVTEEMLQGRELESLEASEHARTNRQSPSQANVNHSEGNVHMALFALLLLSGLDVITLAMFSFPSRRVLDFVLLTLAFVVNIVALIRQSKTDLPGPVRGISWTSMIVMGFIIYSIAGVVSVIAVLQELDLTEALSFEVPEGTWFLVLTTISGATLMILGGLGMMDLFRFRRAYRRLMATQPMAEQPVEETDD